MEYFGNRWILLHRLPETYNKVTVVVGQYLRNVGKIFLSYVFHWSPEGANKGKAHINLTSKNSGLKSGDWEKMLLCKSLHKYSWRT